MLILVCSNKLETNFANENNCFQANKHLLSVSVCGINNTQHRIGLNKLLAHHSRIDNTNITLRRTEHKIFEVLTNPYPTTP